VGHVASANQIKNADFIYGDSLVVFTCSVVPQVGENAIKRGGAQERIQDYLSALPPLLEVCGRLGLDTLIIENSGNLDLLKAAIESHLYSTRALTGEIHYLEAPKDYRSAQEGISGGEFSMLLSAKDIICQGSYKYIWKIGGRNFIYNLERILRPRARADIFAERCFVPRHAVSSRIFGMSAEMWSLFLDEKVVFDLFWGSEGKFSQATFQSMEHYLTSFITDQEFSGASQLPLREFPIFAGMSGSGNKPLTSRSGKRNIMLTRPFRRIAEKLLLGVSP
jgi:hypothetical protein